MHMIKKIMISSIFNVFLLLVAMNAKAATFTDNQVVSSNKSWTIHFNKKVSFDDMSKQGISVNDEKGNKVNVDLNLGQDGSSIIVSAPEAEYEAGKKYKLTIGTQVHNNDSSIKQSVIMNFSIKTGTRGNTVGNIINRGLFAEDDGYIYYDDISNDHKLYRMNKNSANKVKLSYDEANNINVYNGFIYYTNETDGGKIYKMKIDGTGKTKLSDDSRSSNVNVVDGFIYYTNKNGGIYKLKIDGTERTKITYDVAQFINVLDGFIYYRNGSDNGAIYKISINGEHMTKLSNDNATMVVVGDKFIYYTKLNNEGIFKMDLSGNNVTKIYSKAAPINVAGNYVYFLLNGGDIYRMGLVGENVIKLSEGTNVGYVSVINGSIYFADSIYENKDNLYKIGIDGTNKVVL